MRLADHHYHFHLFHLGLVPAGDRKVKSMPTSLSSLVPAPTDNNLTIKGGNWDTEKDTMPLIVNKAKRTAWQSQKLAQKLTGKTMAETLANDDRFILDYIKYEEDDKEKPKAQRNEQVRSPRRLVYDRKGDCDCFTVCLATLLINQGINFYLRIAKYESGDWAHIYIIVPKDQKSMTVAKRSDYTVLDPVTNKHDYEVTYLDKKDYSMGLQFLDGLGECKPVDLKKRKPLLTPLKSLEAQGFVSTGKVLQNTTLPYVQNSNDTFTVSTAQGAKNIPAVLTPDQANLISSDSISSTAAPAPADVAAKKLNWPLILGVATVAVVSIASAANQQKLAGLAAQRKRISIQKI